MKKLIAFTLCLFGFVVGAQADDTYTLKFATLAPQGSTWMNIIGDWA